MVRRALNGRRSNPGSPANCSWRASSSNSGRGGGGETPPIRLRLAFVALFLMAGGASVEAARRMGWLDRILPALSPAPARSRQTRSPARVKVAARTPPVVADIPSPVTVAGFGRRDSGRRGRAAPALNADFPSHGYRRQSGTGNARSFGGNQRARPAIRLLRRQHNAGAALSALDAYLDHYPHGVLNREARFVRVDALLSLQRPDQALDALDTLPLDNHRRSTELQVIRGELRARSIAPAPARFGAVLARNPDDVLAERALGLGRVSGQAGGCEGRLAEDLRRYLERFPNGTHAMWARR